MTTKRQYDYSIGDRVAERPKTHGIFATRKETRELTIKYRAQRYGTVLDIKLRPDKRGCKRKVLVIQWDHLQSPAEHEQARICPVSELDKIVKTTLVPGE